jgi:hypothetical protein
VNTDTDPENPIDNGWSISGYY